MNAWVEACRPRTLWAAVAPVMVGTAMAFRDGLMHAPAALAALAGALCIQIGTNLANDYCDARNGVDTPERRGPVRVTQSGLIPSGQVLRAAVLSFSLAALAGFYLSLRGGWPVTILAAASLLSGVLYSAGPRPLSHLGLGEVFVFFFFGPFAVGGTYYVQGLEINPAVLLSGAACGALSTAIIAVNNLRDISTDILAHKRTLAVRFGHQFARREYLFCMLSAFAVPPLLMALTDGRAYLLGSSVLIFGCIPLIFDVLSTDDPRILNAALARTGKVLFIYSLVFSVLWII